ncbi:PQQ-binding-like beta-propeller repeat protein [Deinococcus sp. Leaf326]|uniref:PQQ-binding-like beta-propeller repeat protein n=1 Tax=Deinococcus sp. Leaf326 TaxID=1736338 RepID=UPI0006F59258|nr:PQQ-binding-like beta-propeller repeat protein [Deinococcus sp. Leaf326]KQR18748.1 hypothetical protein ASF71_20090 [Deinococcus sp. Leaf326]
MRLSTALSLTAALSLFTPALAATATRLVVADGKTHQLKVMSLADGAPIAQFSTPGKLSGLYTGPGGTYAYALHRDDDRVTVLHSGLGAIDHGDHTDLVQKAPYILATLNVGQQPTHFFTHDDRIAIFNDKGGDVAVFGELLLGKTNDMTAVKVAQPDHGAPALLGDVLLSGYLRLNRVDAYDLKTGTLLKTVDLPCPGLHGEGVQGSAAYFGCTDGVLAVTVQGQQVSARKLTNPSGTPTDTRVGTVAGHDKSPALYGNFGTGLARWTHTDTTLTALPLPAAPLKFTFTADGQRLVVLTADGALHTLHAATGRVLQSVKIVAPVNPTDTVAVRPTMTVGAEHTYVTSPATGEVLEVALSDLQVTRRFAVGGTPAMVTLTQAIGEQH